MIHEFHENSRKRGRGKNMKRSIALLLTLALTLGMTGCAGKPAAPAAEAPAAEAPAAKQVVKFAVQADSTEALNKIVEAFNAQNEAYQVEPVVFTNDSGNMHDQLLNSLSSKSGEYDVISMDVVWAGEFAAAGYLEPVDTLIKDAGWMPTDFNAGSMASGKYKGKNYALPYFADLGFLYFRKDIVSAEDAAKLESGNYTYADLQAMSQKYQGQGGTKYGYVYQSKQYEGLTCNLNEFSNNWQDVKGGLETMNAFKEAKVVPADILAYTEGESHNAFLNGEAVFLRNWPYVNGMVASGEYNVKSEQVAYAALPNGGTVGGWILGLNANSKNMEGAKAFVQFLAGPEGQKINATVGSYMPGFNALLSDAEVQKANALLPSAAFQTALSKTIARPVVANYAEVSDKIQIAAHKYLSGNGSLDEAVKAIEEALK